MELTGFVEPSAAAIVKTQTTTTDDQLEAPTDEDSLGLTIAITREGWTVKSGDDAAVASTTIPCLKTGCPTGDSYDAEELTRILSRIKDDWPNEDNVILLPDSNVGYDVLIRTMDTARDDPRTRENQMNRLLFPNAVIAGGAE